MNPTPIDLLIDNGTVFTLDPQRRVLDNASVAVDGDRIVAVGDAAEMRARYAPRQTINAHRKAVLPGLIDSHAHAGHGMLRTMGTGGDAGAWMKAAAQVYTEAERRFVRQIAGFVEQQAARLAVMVADTRAVDEALL